MAGWQALAVRMQGCMHGRTCIGGMLSAGRLPVCLLAGIMLPTTFWSHASTSCGFIPQAENDHHIKDTYNYVTVQASGIASVVL